MLPTRRADIGTVRVFVRALLVSHSLEHFLTLPVPFQASGLTGRGFNLGVGFIDHTNPMWNFSSQPRFHVMFNTTDDMMTMTHYWGWMGGCVPYYLTDPDGIPISCFKQWPTGQVNDTTDINANDFQLNTTLFSAKYPWYTYSTYWWYQTIYEETSVTRYPFGGPYSANYDVFVVTVAGLGASSFSDALIPFVVVVILTLFMPQVTHR